MVGRGRVQAALIIAIVVWSAVLFLEGVTLRFADLRPYSIAIAVVLICLYGFDRWLWRIGPLPRLLGRPVLAGTWKGELRSTWVDHETGEVGAPIAAFLLIRQTYDAISLRLVTARSSSRSETAGLLKAADGVPEVLLIYQNVPLPLQREQSPIHYGAMRLAVHGQPPTRLEGAYWTDRETKGQADFTTYSSRAFSDFASATQATTGSGVNPAPN
jgi:hypothetical protein